MLAYIYLHSQKLGQEMKGSVKLHHLLSLNLPKWFSVCKTKGLISILICFPEQKNGEIVHDVHMKRGRENYILHDPTYDQHHYYIHP